MNPSFLKQYHGTGVFYNRHFWIICGIMLFLILLYNAAFFNITGFPLIFQDISTAKGVHAIISSFLFLIPILYSSVIFKIKGAIIAWFIFLVAILPRAIMEFNSFENLLIVGLFCVVTLLISVLMALDYNPVVQEGGSIALRKTNRWHSLARLLKIRDYERQYMLRNLHDNIIQSLLVVANRAHAMEAGKYGAITAASRKNLEKLELMLLHVIDDVRRLTQDLRPGIMDNVGLIPVLRWHTERIEHESGIKMSLGITGMEYKLPPETEIIIYRIIQEACKNISEHSHATDAALSLDFANTVFTVVIQDNGKGFIVPQSPQEFIEDGKFGIDRIHKQAQLLDGSAKITSEPGKGTRIELSFPV